MVKVSDIRLGNFLLFDFPNGNRMQYRSQRIVNHFDGFRITATINDLRADHVHGISLNAGWLEKLGFEKINRKFQHNWIKNCQARCECYSVQFYQDKYWLSNSEYDAWCYVIRDIEYVHQLQNLYYELTGEELTMQGPAQGTDVH